MYFELEDIKRRHTPYWDTFNVNGWVRTPDTHFSWLYERGAIVGVAAMVLNERLNSFMEATKAILTKYEPPQSFQQARIYIAEGKKFEKINNILKPRLQLGLTLGLTDIAARISIFRYFNNGWQKPYSGGEYLFWRKIPLSMLGALITAPISVPFEMTMRAFLADKTFPKELRKNYTSYFNALRRIPFEEGPYYLFKHSTPFIMRNFTQTFTLFYLFDFLKDKSSVFWRNCELPYLPCKITIATFVSYMACVFSYPWFIIAREMVDFWPKEKDGRCTFDNNYRKAMMHIWYNNEKPNLFPGFFKKYFWKTFPWMFTTLMLADSMGVFSYWCVDFFSGPGTNSWEDSFS